MMLITFERIPLYSKVVAQFLSSLGLRATCVKVLTDKKESEHKGLCRT